MTARVTVHCSACSWSGQRKISAIMRPCPKCRAGVLTGSTPPGRPAAFELGPRRLHLAVPLRLIHRFAKRANARTHALQLAKALDKIVTVRRNGIEVGSASRNGASWLPTKKAP